MRFSRYSPVADPRMRFHVQVIWGKVFQEKKLKSENHRRKGMKLRKGAASRKVLQEAALAWPCQGSMYSCRKQNHTDGRERGRREAQWIWARGYTTDNRRDPGGICQASVNIGWVKSQWKDRIREVEAQHLISMWIYPSIYLWLIIKWDDRRNPPSQDNLVHPALATND